MALNVKGILKASSEPFLQRKKSVPNQRGNRKIIDFDPVEDSLVDKPNTRASQLSYEQLAVANNAFTAGKPTMSVALEPPLQKKRITPYKCNHNIMRTDTTMHKNDDLNVTENPSKCNKNLASVGLSAGVSSSSAVNEPALQKKRIVPYSKNHNILKTRTVEELSDGDFSDKVSDARKFRSAFFSQQQSKRVADALSWTVDDVYQTPSFLLRAAKSFPDLYRSTYDSQFVWKTPMYISPVISADRIALEKKIKESSKVRHYEQRLNLREASSRARVAPEELSPAGFRKDIRDSDARLTRPSSTVAPRSSNPWSYRTEYSSTFSKPIQLASPSHVPVSSRDDLFLEYYRQVLDDRELAYHPELVARMRRDKSNTESAKLVADAKLRNGFVTKERDHPNVNSTGDRSVEQQKQVSSPLSKHASEEEEGVRRSSARSSSSYQQVLDSGEALQSKVNDSSGLAMSGQTIAQKARSEVVTARSRAEKKLSSKADGDKPGKEFEDKARPCSVVSSCCACQRYAKAYNPDNYSDRSSVSLPS